jgi:hypothetical protein
MIKKLLKKFILKVASPLAGKIGSVLSLQLKQPVFIVGTGRCGTSLLVKILHSHPDIVGFLGEANHLWHPKMFPFRKAQVDGATPIEVDPKRFTELSIDSWPANQAERIYQAFNGFRLIAKIAGQGTTFFVKSAMVSFMIPKIVSIFPDARFIHIYRNGPSVVESCYKKNFGNYSDDVFSEEEYYRHCAKYWDSCILEIERIKESLSLVEKNVFFEFSYEELCNDPEGVLKRLAAFIGVEYGKFGFDISKIQSRNYKVGNYLKEEKWRLLLDAMSPGMKLKGYQS